MTVCCNLRAHAKLTPYGSNPLYPIANCLLLGQSQEISFLSIKISSLQLGEIFDLLTKIFSISNYTFRWWKYTKSSFTKRVSKSETLSLYAMLCPFLWLCFFLLSNGMSQNIHTKRQQLNWKGQKRAWNAFSFCVKYIENTRCRVKLLT